MCNLHDEYPVIMSGRVQYVNVEKRENSESDQRNTDAALRGQPSSGKLSDLTERMLRLNFVPALALSRSER